MVVEVRHFEHLSPEQQAQARKVMAARMANRDYDFMGQRQLVLLSENVPVAVIGLSTRDSRSYKVNGLALARRIFPAQSSALRASLGDRSPAEELILHAASALDVHSFEFDLKPRGKELLIKLFEKYRLLPGVSLERQSVGAGPLREAPLKARASWRPVRI